VPSSANSQGWQSYADLGASFPDGTSNTVAFAEKYAYGTITRSTSYKFAGALWANNDNPGDIFSPAFAVTYDWGSGSSSNTYAMFSPAPAMFQVKPTPWNTMSNVNLASTPHEAMNVVMADGSVRAISGNVSPTGVWWPLLTPDGNDTAAPF